MSFSQVMHHHSLKILEQSKNHSSQLFIIIIRKVKRKGVLITKFNDFKYHAEVFKDRYIPFLRFQSRFERKTNNHRYNDKTDEQNDKLPPFIAIMTGAIVNT